MDQASYTRYLLYLSHWHEPLLHLLSDFLSPAHLWLLLGVHLFHLVMQKLNERRKDCCHGHGCVSQCAQAHFWQVTLPTNLCLQPPLSALTTKFGFFTINRWEA